MIVISYGLISLFLCFTHRLMFHETLDMFHAATHGHMFSTPQIDLNNLNNYGTIYGLNYESNYGLNSVINETISVYNTLFSYSDYEKPGT